MLEHVICLVRGWEGYADYEYLLLSLWKCEHCLLVNDFLLARIVLYSWFNTIALKPTWLLLKTSLHSDHSQSSESGGCLCFHWMPWDAGTPCVFLISAMLENSLYRYFNYPASPILHLLSWSGPPLLAWCSLEPCLSGVDWLWSRITLQLD